MTKKIINNLLKKAVSFVVFGILIFSMIPAQLLFAADTSIKGTTSDLSSLALEIVNSSDTSLMSVRNDGNIGIGTTTPTQKLSVDGTFGFLETGASPSFYTIFQGGDQAADITYTWPTAQGGVDTYLKNDGSGNLSWSTVAVGSSAISALTAAAADNTINNGNFNQVWNWSLTGATNALDLSENVASTGTGYILTVGTIASSTAKPFKVSALGSTLIDTTALGDLTLGNTTGATAVNIMSGSGNINFTGNILANGNTTLGDADTDRVTFTSQVVGASPLVFQGGTDDAFKSTIAITDPTADRTITFQDASGTVAFLSDISGVLGDLADNVPDALDIQEGSNNYININTTNSSENISFGNATTNPSYSFLGSGTTTFNGPVINATATVSVTAGSGITTVMLTSNHLKISGSGGAVDIIAADQIADAVSGQMLVLEGTSNSNTVKIESGDNVQLCSNVSFTLGTEDVLMLIFNGTEWIEIMRQNN